MRFLFHEFPELIVDNFAGGGGASTGIELATGRSPDIAINHSREALLLHAANHAGTHHLCEDVWQIDPRKVCQNKRVGLAWFSPDCTHHSRAKGGKPRNQRIRGLAWVAQKWAGTVKPQLIILENVEEFRQWGPLIAKRCGQTGRVLKTDGSVAGVGEVVPRSSQFLVPDARRVGKTFRRFQSQLKGLGYAVDTRELKACDYGAPTIRKRMFLIARRDGQPICWPTPTHGASRSPGVISGQLQPYRTAAECIDWSIPCPSIFTRKKPLAEATLKRIARGLRKFVIETDSPFVVPGAGASLITTGYGEREGQLPRVPNINDPMGTVVAGGGKCALMMAFLAKHYSGDQLHAADLNGPMHTVTATDHHALVGVHLIRHFGESVGSPLTEPMGTVTAGGGGKSGICVSYLSKLYRTTVGQSMEDPMHTVTGGGNHLAEVRAFLVKYYGNDKEGCSLHQPMHTVTAKDRLGLVIVSGEEYQITDIGMRMLEPRELFKAQGFPKDYVIDRGANGEKLSKTVQVRLCGNSVCPPLATALVSANAPHLGVHLTEARAA